MNHTAPTTWHGDTTLPSFAPIQHDVRAEVCVIGGGLCGLMSAYLLAKAGKDVVLIEKNTIGSGATGMTTGFLTAVIDTSLSDLSSMFGKDIAQEIIASHQAAIDLVEHIAQEERISCEFMRTSNYLYAGSEQEQTFLEKEHAAAQELGLSVAYSETPLLPFATYGHLEVKEQAKYHPLKFLAGLAHAALDRGVRIYEHTEALEVTDHSPRHITTAQGTAHAASVIAATYRPFNEPASLFLKKGMYTTYVFELSIPTGSLPEALYEDQQNPYHYFRVDSGESSDRLIVGGEDHRQDIPVDEGKNFQALERFVQTTFTDIPYTTVRQWTGPILEPSDGLAFIGDNGDPALQYAFGFSGTGMTYAPIAAMIVSDTILGKSNPWRGLYAAERIPKPKSLIVKGRDYAEELVKGAVKNTLRYRKRNQHRE